MAEFNASLAVSDQDAYLFAQGKWFQSHKKLGAHPAVQEDGAEGYHFAVWAPNAASVSAMYLLPMRARFIASFCASLNLKISR